MRGLRTTTLAAALYLGVACLPAPAGAQVEVETSRAGRTVIHNENDVQRGRRLAVRMVRPPVEELLPLIERYAFARGLDPRLVRAVVQAESGYNPLAVSVKGAQGLMQLMPETARELGIAQPFDAAENLRGGTEYLRRMIARFDGRIELALAAYNAGPGAVERYGGVPPYPETREYVARVLALWRGAAAPSIRFASWSPGGRSATARAPAPSRPVGWRSDGERPHLTNIESR